jgi:NSS family neurotransmitter:Na+ symporter
MDMLDTYDWISNSIFLPLGGILTAVFTGYVWGGTRAAREVGRGRKISGIVRIWVWLIRYVVPVLIIVIMAAGIYDTFVR